MSYNARVPAWKRLGLKLKGPAAGEDPVSAPSSGNATGHPTQASQQRNGQNSLNASPASALKRKPQAPIQTPSKKIRLDEQTPGSVPSTLKRQKSVTFAEGTKETSKTAKDGKPKQPKKQKEPKKKAEAAPKADFSLEPALAYLRQWRTARESWKFNKNHQTLLIKYLFDAEKVPSAEIPIFYEYIRDLKGFVRTRLRETAQEIKKEDMEKGVEAFPSTTKDKETKQKEYEAVISDFLKTQHQLQQQRQQNGGTSSGVNANGKRSFDEVEFVIRIAHPEVKQRLFKRIRAEMVLDELSDSESTISTDTTMTTTSTTSSTADKEMANGGEPPKRGAPSTKASEQPAKRRRLRKVRTDIGDDDSSSDSSSDDDSDSSDDDDDDEKKSDDEDDSSSSSSSSDSDSDEEMTTPEEEAEGNDSSSSSSSSSESESESEASDAGNDAEDSSSSESSDSDDD